MKSLLVIPLALLSVASVVVLGLLGCYNATDVPPCTGKEPWPDPCAAGGRDAGDG